MSLLQQVSLPVEAGFGQWWFQANSRSFMPIRAVPSDFIGFALRRALISLGLKGLGGESGIRTHVRVSPKHAFQACAFNHSAISPERNCLLEFTIGARSAVLGVEPSADPRQAAGDARMGVKMKSFTSAARLVYLDIAKTPVLQGGAAFDHRAAQLPRERGD